MFRRLSLTEHGLLELLAGLALIGAPLVLGLGLVPLTAGIGAGRADRRRSALLRGHADLGPHGRRHGARRTVLLAAAAALAAAGEPTAATLLARRRRGRAGAERVYALDAPGAHGKPILLPIRPQSPLQALPGDPFDALGDPHRRAIVELLQDGDRSVRELADALPISRPAVSRHLRLLKEAGLVIDRAEGTRRLYRLHDEGIEAVRAYLEQVWGEAAGRFRMLADN